MNGDGKMLPVDKCGGRVKKHQEGGRADYTTALPFYGTYKEFSNGEPFLGAISAVGDVASIFGLGGIGKVAKSRSLAKKAKEVVPSLKQYFPHVFNAGWFPLTTGVIKGAAEKEKETTAKLKLPSKGQ